VDGEAVLLLQSEGVRDELVRRAHLAFARLVGEAEEQVRRERHPVAQLAAEQVVHGHVEVLTDQVQAGELDGGQQLGAVVVEARGRVGDREPQGLQRERVVPDQVLAEAADRLLSALSAAAQLAEPDQAVVRLDLHDGADEAAPVCPVGVPQRRFERDGHRGGPDIDDLHGRALSRATARKPPAGTVTSAAPSEMGSGERDRSRLVPTKAARIPGTRSETDTGSAATDDR
jgi:hypothetical protein